MKTTEYRFSICKDDIHGTSISCSGDEQTGYRVKIGAATGNYFGQESRRAYILQLHGFPEPHEIQVDGHTLKQGVKIGAWIRDPQTGTVEISIPRRDIRKSAEVVLH